MSQNQSTSLQISNVSLAKCIGENIYLLGFTGSKDLVIQMANKLHEIFGEIDSEILKEIFNEFHSGTRTFKYVFNISDISIALRDKGILTKSELIMKENTGIDFSKMRM